MYHQKNWLIDQISSEIVLPQEDGIKEKTKNKVYHAKKCITLALLLHWYQ